MEITHYTVEYLKNLTREDLVGIMKEHGYEEGHTTWSTEELIGQISNISSN